MPGAQNLSFAKPQIPHARESGCGLLAGKVMADGNLAPTPVLLISKSVGMLVNDTILRRRIRRHLWSWFLRWHQFPSGTPQAPHTVLPFPFPAPWFAAVELTEGIILGNRADKLLRSPIPDFSKKAHGVAATAFGFTRTFRNLSCSATLRQS